MAKAIESKNPKPPAKTTFDDFQALVNRASEGDYKALTRLREVINSEEHPDWAEWLRDTLGNPAHWLHGSLAALAGKKNLAAIDASRAKMADLRTSLEGPNPSPLERLLVERAVQCWFLVNAQETIYLQSDGLSIKQADYHIRKIEATHRRFLSAVATLARVRKLALPSIQMNIAGQMTIGKPG